MKKLLIAAVVATISSGALAADLKPYIEGQVGYLNADDIDTKTYSGSLSDSSLNGKLKLKYDSDVIWGGEVGLRDVGGIPNLRIGASYSRAEIDLDTLTILANGTTLIKNTAGTTVGSASANASLALDRGGVSASGTVTYTDNGGTTGVAASGRVANASLAPTFVTAKNDLLNGLKKDINLYMANAYYDFKNSTPFTPYVGAGLGLASIKDTKGTELAYSLMAGAKYNINNNVYVGAKGTYTRVNSPTSNKYGVDIELDDIDLWRADAVVGYEF